MLLATAAVVAMIWLVGIFVPSHVGFEPARWAPLSSAASDWDFNGPPEAITVGGGLTLRSRPEHTYRAVSSIALQRPADESARLLVSGRLLEEPGTTSSGGSAVFGIRFVTASGETFGYTRLRAVPEPATTLERFAEVVAWPAGAVAAEAMLHSQPGAPTVTLVEGSAEIVRPNAWYALSLAITACAVIAWCLMLVRYAREREAVRSLILPSVALLVIVCGVTLSVGTLRQAFLPVLGVAQQASGIGPANLSPLLLKGGHAFGFFALALLLLAARRRFHLRRRHVAAFVALLAIGSEGLQLHLSDRGATVDDVLIDLLGVALAFALFAAVRERRRRPARRRRSERRRASRSGASDESAAKEGRGADHSGDARGHGEASRSARATGVPTARTMFAAMPDIGLDPITVRRDAERDADDLAIVSDTVKRRRRRSRRRRAPSLSP